MAPDYVVIGGLAAGMLAGLVGLAILVRTWGMLRRGPGGDLTREVIYLKGPDLSRPIRWLVAALFIEVLKQGYSILMLVGAAPASPDFRLHASVFQTLLVLIGGFAFHGALRGFTPAARTTRRRELLDLLSRAIQSRGRSLRPKEP